MENIFANHITDRELISKMYRELIQLTSGGGKKIRLKLGRESNQTSLQGEPQIATKHVKTYSMSLIIREKQIKTLKVLNITNH